MSLTTSVDISPKLDQFDHITCTQARPRPTIKWTRDDTDVDEALINDMEGISQLAIRGSRSWHTGSYTIALTNSSGTQKLTIKVVVIGL